MEQEQEVVSQEVLDDIEANFYAEKQTIKNTPPKPSLSAERKIEILDQLKRQGYNVLDSREKAFQLLEKLLRTRTPEQNIIARICYLLIFEAFKVHDQRSVLPKIMGRIK